jgi:hypothetical protein
VEKAQPACSPSSAATAATVANCTSTDTSDGGGADDGEKEEEGSEAAEHCANERECGPPFTFAMDLSHNQKIRSACESVCSIHACMYMQVSVHHTCLHGMCIGSV